MTGYLIVLGKAIALSPQSDNVAICISIEFMLCVISLALKLSDLSVSTVVL